MRLAVFGATGRTGRHLVDQALARSHEITALCRDPGRMRLQHPALQVITGHIRDRDLIAQALEGQDAVVCTLGQNATSGRDVLSCAAENLIPAMEQAGVRRIVSLICAAVPDPRDPRPTLDTRLRNKLMGLLAARAIRDAAHHARLVRHSGLEWTLARPPRLTDGPRTGRYRAGWFQLSIGACLSRADAADFLLRELEECRFVGQAPMVTY